MKGESMLIIAIFSGIASYIKLLTYKAIYLSKLKFKRLITCYLGTGSKVIINDIDASIKIGENFKCRDYVRIKCTKGNISIGDNVFLNNLCSINCRNKIDIGDNCIFGEGVKIYDHDHVYKTDSLIRESGFIEKGVAIGKNVWIGSNSIILKGVTIGDNIVIAAGTIVKKDIESGKLMYNKNEEQYIAIK